MVYGKAYSENKSTHVSKQGANPSFTRSVGGSSLDWPNQGMSLITKSYLVLSHSHDSRAHKSSFENEHVAFPTLNIVFNVTNSICHAQY